MRVSSNYQWQVPWRRWLRVVVLRPQSEACDLHNLFIESLPEAERNLLQPLLRPLSLDQQTILFEVGQTVSHTYFPTRAIISLVITMSSGQMIETAMVGRDGVVGALPALGGKISVSRAIVQLGGRALVCDADAFKHATLQSPHLLSSVIRHEQAAFAQAQQSAGCNASHSVEARLARWLLRARDLAGTEALPFTQEFLGEMLGVQRTSVSVVAHTLQQAGMIHYRRGKIQITDVDALEQTTCECHGVIKQQYHTLLGQDALR